MFTRCPSCKSEISFEPPENFEFLPDGYRHRLQCPNCGIAIGVRIPKPPPKVIEEINIDNIINPNNESGLVLVKEKEKPLRKRRQRGYEESQITRTLIIFFISLFFFFWPFISYGVNSLQKSKTIPAGLLLYFFDIDPINVLVEMINLSKAKDKIGLREFFANNVMTNTANLFGMFLMITALICIILCILGFVAKRYLRSTTMVVSLIVGILGIGTLLFPMFRSLSVIGIENFFKEVINKGRYIYFVYPIIGLLQLVLGFVFMRRYEEE